MISFITLQTIVVHSSEWIKRLEQQIYDRFKLVQIIIEKVHIKRKNDVEIVIE
jgi:hypothetical protein